MQSNMQYVSAGHYIEVSGSDPSVMSSRLSHIEIQLLWVKTNGHNASMLCVPDEAMISEGLKDKGTICCRRGNCWENCLLYYTHKFDRAVKLLEELSDVIKTEKAVPKDA